MPIPTPTPSPIPLFPSLTREHIDGTRTSAWYLPFRSITIPSIIIDLDQLGEREAFLEVSEIVHHTACHLSEFVLMDHDLVVVRR